MNQQSELTIVTEAKELCSYIVTVTQKSPKQFRFTFVSRLQNLSLDAVGLGLYAKKRIHKKPAAKPWLSKAGRQAAFGRSNTNGTLKYIFGVLLIAEF